MEAAATRDPIDFARAELLPLDAKRLICNGIGPGRGKTIWTKALWTLCLPLIAIPWALGLQEAFRRAGDDHDLHYFMGGKPRHKRLGDGLFLGQLFDTVSHWGIVFRPFGWLVGLLYFCLVALLGWGSFKRRDQPIEFGEVADVARRELS